MRSEIKSLTGLRGVAACWVMIGHYFAVFSGDGTLHTVVTHMYVAVDLFMILSGFVLAMTYEDRFAALTPRHYARFLWQRLARLFPLYALVVTGCLAMMEAGVGLNMCDLSPLGVALNFLMMQAWYWPDDSLTGTGWSLSIEWGANLLFPVFVLLLLRPSARRAAIAAGAAAGALAWQALSHGQGGDGQPFTGAIDWYYVPDSLIRCLTEFMLGMYCWRLRSRSAWSGRLGETTALAGVAGALIATIVFPLFDVAFVVLACCLVIGLSYQRSLLHRALGSAIPSWLGQISFSIYLLHLPILPIRGLLIEWLSGRHIVDAYQVTSPAQGAVCVAVVLGLSSLSFHCVEKPAQRWMRQAFAGGGVLVVSPAA